eukprot:760071-Hanusia_phi.AAC.6
MSAIAPTAKSTGKTILPGRVVCITRRPMPSELLAFPCSMSLLLAPSLSSSAIISSSLLPPLPPPPSLSIATLGGRIGPSPTVGL